MQLLITFITSAMVHLILITKISNSFFYVYSISTNLDYLMTTIGFMVISLILILQFNILFFYTSLCTLSFWNHNLVWNWCYKKHNPPDNQVYTRRIPVSWAICQLFFRNPSEISTVISKTERRSKMATLKKMMWLLVVICLTCWLYSRLYYFNSKQTKRVFVRFL